MKISPEYALTATIIIASSFFYQPAYSDVKKQGCDATYKDDNGNFVKACGGRLGISFTVDQRTKDMVRTEDISIKTPFGGPNSIFSETFRAIGSIKLW